MNCKPGDLAVIVSGIPADNIGKIIKVLTVEDRWYGLAWDYEGALYGANFPGVRADRVADSCLRPIRDPGEDATDEMVELLGKPVAKPEGVAA